MIDTQSLLLLRQTRALLSRRLLLWPAKRKLATAITWFIALRLPPSTAVERVARRKIRAFADIDLDRGEKQIRAHPSGVEIRVWCLLRHEELSWLGEEQALTEPERLALPALTCQILALSQQHGLEGPEIALLLGLSRRAVRRHLRRAVRVVAGR